MCPICKVMYRKFSRHIFQVHANDKEVAAVKNLAPKDKKRLQVLATLRSRGIMLYNIQQESPRKFILARTKKDIVKEQYTQCYLCGCSYKKIYLSKHIKKCPKNDGTFASKTALRTAEKKLHMNPEEQQNNIKYSEDIICGMQDGVIKRTIETEETLVLYGKWLCQHYGSERHLINLIRRKLRQVAAVFLAAQTIDEEIHSVKDLFQPKKKDTTFEAVKKVTGFEKGIFSKPAMANEMGTTLQAVAQRVLIKAQMEEDEQSEKNIQRWISILKLEYNSLIAKHARKTLEENQWNKPKVLPMTEDIMRLNQHVKRNIEESKEKLEEEFSIPEWGKLVKSIMIKILLFNRKRAGDVHFMKLEEFQKAHGLEPGTATDDLLTDAERAMASLYKRVEVRGKRAKGTPILLTMTMMDDIYVLIQLRDLAGIPPTNQFIFAKKGQTHFDTGIVLKEMAYACGAKKPENLTGTKLRKQIATATQAFNFSENDLSVLAAFMGHTVKTHKTFYRLPDGPIQLARISTILQAIDNGKISELKGKSLQELDEIVKKLMQEQDDAKEDQSTQASEKTRTGIRTPKKKSGLKIIRTTWSTPENAAMKLVMKKHLQNLTLPNPQECFEAQKKHSPLKRRTVDQIKAWVYNKNVKAKKVLQNAKKPSTSDKRN